MTNCSLPTWRHFMNALLPTGKDCIGARQVKYNIVADEIVEIEFLMTLSRKKQWLWVRFFFTATLKINFQRFEAASLACDDFAFHRKYSKYSLSITGVVEWRRLSRLRLRKIKYKKSYLVWSDTIRLSSSEGDNFHSNFSWKIVIKIVKFNSRNESKLTLKLKVCAPVEN